MILAAINWAKWSAIGTIIAAGATAFLGTVTWSLVRATKSIVAGGRDEAAATKLLAQATSRQATIASHALALQSEPRIVPVHEAAPRFDPPENIGGTLSDHWVSPLVIEVENAGMGLAELTRVEIVVSDWGPVDRVLYPGLIRSGARAALRAEFTTSAESDAWGGVMAKELSIPHGGDVFVRVHYRAVGERDYQVAFAWKRAAGSEARWELRLTEYVDP